MRYILPALVAMAAIVTIHADPAQALSQGDEVPMHITVYQPTGNPTYSGEWPHDGTAGCSIDIPLGSELELPDGRVVVCDDRGADAFMAPHLDLFCAESLDTCLSEDPWAGNWTVPAEVTVLRVGW